MFSHFPVAVGTMFILQAHGIKAKENASCFSIFDFCVAWCQGLHRNLFRMYFVEFTLTFVGLLVSTPGAILPFAGLGAMEACFVLKYNTEINSKIGKNRNSVHVFVYNLM